MVGHAIVQRRPGPVLGPALAHWARTDPWRIGSASFVLRAAWNAADKWVTPRERARRMRTHSGRGEIIRTYPTAEGFRKALSATTVQSRWRTWSAAATRKDHKSEKIHTLRS
jgi:hypothetical protein